VLYPEEGRDGGTRWVRDLAGGEPRRKSLYPRWELNPCLVRRQSGIDNIYGIIVIYNKMLSTVVTVFVFRIAYFL
jgi:hypothetical protein